MKSNPTQRLDSPRSLPLRRLTLFDSYRAGESAPDVIPEESLVDLGAEDGFTIRLLRLGNYRGGAVQAESS